MGVEGVTRNRGRVETYLKLKRRCVFSGIQVSTTYAAGIAD